MATWEILAKHYAKKWRQRWLQALLVGFVLAALQPADGIGPRLVVFGFITIMARMGEASFNNEAQERAELKAAKKAGT